MFNNDGTGADKSDVGRTDLIKLTDATQMVEDCSKLCSVSFQQVPEKGNEHFY